MPYVGNTAQKLVTADDVTVTDDLTVTDDASVGGDLTVTGTIDGSDSVTFTSSTSSKPVLTLKNTNADQWPPAITFQKDSASPADGDVVANINFYGDDDGGNVAAYANLKVYADDVSNGSEDGSFVFQTMTAGTLSNALTIVSDGDIDVEKGDIFFSTAGKGIVLGATSNTDANTLDDYEEGTFTPTILGSSSNPSSTYSSQVGIYTKIGNLVRVKIFIETTNYSGGGGDLRIGDLPFTSRNVTNTSSVGSVSFYNVNSFDDGNDVAFVGDNKNYVSIRGRSGTSASDAWSFLPVSVWTSANPTAINLNVTYFT